MTTDTATLAAPRAVALVVNGVPRSIEVEPRRSLADALRDQLGLTGTHLGCEHGVCGACTVLLDDEPVRACLVFAVQAEGRAVRTVEGLAGEGLAGGEGLNDLQESFRTHHGLQCGYCTPGFLMLATWLLERPEPLDEDALRHGLASNLCRCTGYQTILDAVRATARARGKWTASAPA